MHDVWDDVTNGGCRDLIAAPTFLRLEPSVLPRMAGGGGNPRGQARSTIALSMRSEVFQRLKLRETLPLE